MSLLSRCACAALLSMALPVQAKPIAFANGYTFMAEYGAGTMQEVQAFYAPKSWYSLGAGYLRIDADDGSYGRDIPYLRGNLLLHRWNRRGAQANAFGWAGFGDGTYHGGLQFDRESLRTYASLKSEYQGGAEHAARIDTLQLGLAPYPHRYDGLATWIVVQARDYTGGIYDGVETALLLRLFRGPIWIEAGVTADGKLQSMFMFNY